jgi:hypothetical protein
VAFASTASSGNFFFFNCSPGSIATEFFDKKGISKEVREQVFRKKICKFQIYKSHTNPVNIPLGRTGTAEDIAKVILFLADRQQSEFVIGVKWGLLRITFFSSLVADGGSVLSIPLFVAPRT